MSFLIGSIAWWINTFFTIWYFSDENNTEEDPPPDGHNTTSSDPSIAVATAQEDPSSATGVDAARVEADEIFDVITQHEVTVSQLEGATDAKWVDLLPPWCGAGCINLGWKVCLPRISEKHC